MIVYIKWFIKHYYFDFHYYYYPYNKYVVEFQEKHILMLFFIDREYIKFINICLKWKYFYN